MRTKTKKKTGILEKDFGIMLDVMADGAIERTASLLDANYGAKLYSLRDDIKSALVTRANECYAAQVKASKGPLGFKGTFAAIKDATKMRDTLIVFMQHWLAGILSDLDRRDILDRLPKGYGYNRVF